MTNSTQAAIAKAVENFCLATEGTRDELELMAEAYYNYLILPLATASILFKTTQILEIEIGKVDTLILNIGTPRSGFIAEGITLNQFKLLPRVGQRRLPKIFQDAGLMGEVFALISTNKAYDAWKDNDFDILLGIYIAQCMALVRYKEKLQKMILEHKSNLVRESQPRFDFFKWNGTPEQLDRLYLGLRKEIIECTKEEFLMAFSNIPIKSPLKIKWRLLGKNGRVSKVSILFFLDKLMKKGLIPNLNNTPLFNIIERVFVDLNDKHVVNLKQSYKTSGNAKKSDQTMIEDIIDAL